MNDPDPVHLKGAIAWLAQIILWFILVCGNYLGCFLQPTHHCMFRVTNPPPRVQDRLPSAPNVCKL